MRKVFRLVKRYWYVVLIIPVGILVWRYFPRAFAKTKATPNVTRPPIDGSGGTNPDDWGALTPAPFEDTTIPAWDNIEPFDGWGDDNQPLTPGEFYTVDPIKPPSESEIEFAGKGGVYY